MFENHNGYLSSWTESRLSELRAEARQAHLRSGERAGHGIATWPQEGLARLGEALVTVGMRLQRVGR